MPTAGKRRAVPTAGKRRAVPTAGKRRAVPTAGSKETVQQQAEVRGVCTRTKRSASSPSTKGGGEKSVIWLRERNKVIGEVDQVRRSRRTRSGSAHAAHQGSAHPGRLGTVKNVERLLSARRRRSVKLQEEAVIPQEYV